MGENIELNGETLDILEENEESEETEIIELQTTAIKAPPKPKIEPRTPEHFALIDKIFLYKKTFPTLCEHIETNKFDKMSLAELRGTVDLCAKAAADRPNSQFHKVAFKTMLSFGEVYIAPKLNMNLKGLTNTALEDENLMQCLDELVLTHDFSPRNMTPESRFIMAFGMVALRVNNHNKMLEREQQQIEKTPEQTEKFDDI